MSEIKIHKRKEIGDWKQKAIKTYFCDLFVAGDIKLIEECCREACFPSGLCVSVSEVKYIFGGGSEDGYKITALQYPPFPEDEKVLLEKMISLGKKIIEKNYQYSFSIVTPKETHFYSRIK